MTSEKQTIDDKNGNGAKWDRCLTGAIMTTASGLLLGAVFSVLLFKRRPWPVFFGTGIGIGMSYSNCQNNLCSSSAHSQSYPISKVD